MNGVRLHILCATQTRGHHFTINDGIHELHETPRTSADWSMYRKEWRARQR